MSAANTKERLPYTHRLAARAAIEITSYTVDDETKRADAAASLFFRPWTTSVQIERDYESKNVVVLRLWKEVGSKEGIITAWVNVGSGDTDGPVRWRVTSYRDETEGRCLSGKEMGYYGICRTLTEAHQIVAARIATLKAMPVPGWREVEEQKLRIAVEEDALKKKHDEYMASLRAKNADRAATGEAA